MTNNPLLVRDIKQKLREIYNEHQMAALEKLAVERGIEWGSDDLEIVPACDINERAISLAMAMSGLAAIPWCIVVNWEATTALVKRVSFTTISLFGDLYYAPASFYRPRTDMLYVSLDGVKIGGAMPDC